MQTNDTQRLTVSAREAGAMLGVSDRVVWRQVRLGRLPAVRVGKRVYIPVEALRAKFNVS